MFSHATLKRLGCMKFTVGWKYLHNDNQASQHWPVSHTLALLTSVLHYTTIRNAKSIPYLFSDTKSHHVPTKQKDKVNNNS